MPLSSAQETTPRVEVALSGLPDRPVNTTGAQYTQPFQVHLALAGMVCRQAQPVQIGLTATSAPLAAEAFRFDPSPLVFTVPAGQYLTAPHSDDERVNLFITPAAVPPEGLDVPIVIRAAFAGGALSNCGGNGNPEESDASHSFTVEFRHGGPLPTTPAPKMPAPSAALALLGLVALALLRRRL